MATLASLAVKLGLDPKKFTSGLATARKSIKEFRSGIDSSSRDVATLGNALSAVGKPGAILALAGAAVSLTSALTPAAGALLALPAATLVAGAAFAVLKIGTSGLGDALSALASGDAAAAEEALKKLAPEAQVFARSLNAVRERYGALKRTVQNNLFAGLGTEVERLGERYLPTLDKGLGKVATSLNGMAKEATGAASTPFFRGAVADVLSRTAGVMDTLRPAVSGLMESVLALAQGGMPLIERFAAWVSGGMDAAGAFLSSGRGANWMHQKVTAAQEVLSQLWQIAKNIGAGLKGLFDGASDSGTRFLDTLVSLTARFAAWAKSAEGQEKITRLLRVLGDVLAGVLTSVMLLAAAVMAVVESIDALPGPVQSVVTTFIAWSLITGLLVTKFAPLIATLIRLGPILLGVGTKAVAAAGKVGLFALRMGLMAATAIGHATMMALSVSAKFVMMAAVATAQMIRMAAVVAAQWIAMAAVAMARAAMMAAAWFIALGPIGWVIAAIIGLVALIIANWDTVKSVSSAVWDAVWGLVSEKAAAIAGFVGEKVDEVLRFIDYLRALPDKARAFFGGLNDAARNKLDELINWIKGVPGWILDALGDLGSLLWNAGQSVVDGLIGGILSMGSYLKNKILNFIRSFVPGPVLQFLGISSPSKLFIRIGKNVGLGLAEGITGSHSVVASAAVRLADTVASAAAGMTGTVAVDFGSIPDAAWDKLLGMGYKGRPDDGREALYVPRNVLASVSGAGGGQAPLLRFESGGSELDDLLLKLVRRALRGRGMEGLIG